jgi:predicted PurR-regulated permease PerM
MLWRFLPALAWALVLAIATWPLRQMLVRRGIGGTGAAALLTLGVVLVLVLPLVGFAVEAARDNGAIVESVREIRQNAPDWLSHLPYVGSSLAEWWKTNVAAPGSGRALVGAGQPNGMFSLTRTVGAEVAHRIVILAFTILALFFLYRDGPLLSDQSYTVADRLFGPAGGRLGKNAVTAVRATVNGLVLVGFAEGALLGAAYKMAGLPHAALLGLATAVLATVPFGAPLVFIGCALFLFAQSQTAAAVALLVFGTIVAFVADHAARPILIGGSTRLPFLWVLLGILGGLETFGLIGLFLGPAIMSVLVAIWREGAE